MMPFPFSFVFAVPGIANPFGPPDQLHGQASPQSSNAHIDPSQNGSSNNATKPVKKNLLRRRTPPPPDLEPPQPISKKRRWVPSRPEPSQPKASRTSVKGSKYPEMQSSEAGSDAGADIGEGEFSAFLRSLVLGEDGVEHHRSSREIGGGSRSRYGCDLVAGRRLRPFCMSYSWTFCFRMVLGSVHGVLVELRCISLAVCACLGRAVTAQVVVGRR